MKPEPRKSYLIKKQSDQLNLKKRTITKSALENLKTEKERIVDSLKKSGEID